jgi:RAD51-like protein 3
MTVVCASALEGDKVGPFTRISTRFFQQSTTPLPTPNQVLYIDAHGAITGSRLIDILDILSPGTDLASALAASQNIAVAVVADIFQAMEALEAHYEQLCAAEPSGRRRGGVVVVDSVPALLSPILGGGQYQGHALMQSLAATLRRLAHHCNCGVLLTNYYVAAGAGPHGARDAVKPALGASWVNVPSIRIDLAELQH